MKLSPSIVLLSVIATGLIGAAPPEIRVATYNISLSPNSPSSLVAMLGNPSSSSPRRVAEIIQRNAPDILLINELNDPGTTANLDALHDNFIAVSQNGQPAQDYPYRFRAGSNTGVHSGFDLDNSGSMNSNPGTETYGNDCFGFGRFPGQFSMAVLSKYPIQISDVRTLQNFLWQDMPGAFLPDIGGSPAPGDWYSTAELAVFRLSSKSHWDIPINVDGRIVHLLCAHPTPPTFDGSENRNGLRNHDEIRLWADYIDPARDDYIYDDAGVFGGLGANQRFVIVGDYNADPVDGDSFGGAAQQLTEHPLIDNAVVPARSDGNTDTANFSGGLRVDYALPSRAGFDHLGGAVFWPTGAEPGASLVSVSDHRLVYADLALVPFSGEAVPDLQVAVDGDDILLTWSAANGINYGVQSTSDLTAGQWSGSLPMTENAGQATARDVGAATSGGRRFYRVSAAFE